MNSSVHILLHDIIQGEIPLKFSVIVFSPNAFGATMGIKSFRHLLHETVRASDFTATQIRSDKRGMTGFQHPITGQCIVLSSDHFERE